MEQAERIENFLDLIHCNHPMDYWLYDDQMGLLRSTSSSEVILDSVIRRNGDLEALYAAGYTVPTVLTGDFGVAWIAVREMRNKEVEQLHVLGPFFSNEARYLPEVILERVGDNASQRWKDALLDILRRLPAVSLSFYCQYAVMLHYLVTGERISASDIQYETSSPPAAAKHYDGMSPSPAIKDRMWIYRAERALLHAVREGDMDAARVAQDDAAAIVGRVRQYTGDPLKNVQIACTTFATLCSRAAIEGGLPTTLAYSVGDAYIKSFFLARTPSEVVDLRVRMYEDFITRVHDIRCNPSYSKIVQSCCDYIILHVAEPLSIAILAERLGYAKYYLSARFKKETGTSVNEYIRYARVERAKLYLATTKKSVEDVCAATGFASRVHFERVFKQVTGMTPSQYRTENLTT